MSLSTVDTSFLTEPITPNNATMFSFSWDTLMSGLDSNSSSNSSNVPSNVVR